MWAQGPGAPAGVTRGTWQPDATQLAQFATAAALRYDGRCPDPMVPGAFLPRVRYWQPWNEPNLSYYLAPQWTRAGGRWVAASPVIYRGLLNAVYAAVKRVSSSNFVVTAGTAPYGDPPGGERMQPVAFDRSLFCLRDNARLTPLSCPDPRPAGPKRLWVTELSWDSSPPDPAGVPAGKQALWLEQALYVLWQQGVDTVLWLQIVDSPPVPSYGATYQSGLFYLGGVAKPAAQAFRFPFVTRRLSRGRIQAWGRALRGGRIAIEQQRGSRWVVLRRLAMRGDQVFDVVLSVRGRATLRAQADPVTSLAWTQRR